MAPQTVRNQESSFNLRLDAGLKAEFQAAVEGENRPAAEVLRSLMAGLRGGVPEAALCRRGAASIPVDRRFRGRSGGDALDPGC